MRSTIYKIGGMKTTKWYVGKRDDFGRALLFVEERNANKRVVHRAELHSVHPDGIDWSYIGNLPSRCATLIVADLIGDTGELPSVKLNRAEPAMLRITSNILAGLSRGDWSMKAEVFVKHLWFRDRLRYRWNRFKQSFKRKEADAEAAI